jgi:predicted RNA polymerase sigma factor
VISEPVGPVPATDDGLTPLVLCCHPALSSVSRVALTLRAVGGLTTAEHAYGTTEATMATGSAARSSS